MRKWLLPGFATPLLIVRDPVALLLILLSLKENLLRSNMYLSGTILLGIVSFFTAIFFGHGNLFVALFGARIFLLHFPVIFIIGRIFNKNDVIKVGKVILWLSIPMTVLIILQFYSPQSAWVNRGVGGDLNGAGFNGGALGYFRPPGTFSFTNGNTLFYSLVACFVFYFWINPKSVNRVLLITASISLFISIPISISRTLLFQVAVSLVFAGLALVNNRKYLGRLIVAFMASTIVIFLLSKMPVFSTAVEAFSVRFENASEYEGGLKGTLGNRFLGSMTGSFSNSPDLPFFGYGLGMGTNAGSQLLTGKVNFLIAEEEWPRLIGEMGTLLGIFAILIRVGLSVKITAACYRKLKFDECLAWMVLSFEILLLVKGQLGQPVSLGFFTLGGGLVIAALKSGRNPDKQKPKNFIRNKFRPYVSYRDSALMN